MDLRRIGAAACTVTLCVGLTGAGGDSGEAAAELVRWKRCGKVDVGHTKARVSAKKVRCRTARRAVRRFVRKYPGRKSLRCWPRSGEVRVCWVGRFACTLGGGEGIVKLACSDPARPDGDLRARWGD
jgi:hypothetical protein